MKLGSVMERRAFLSEVLGTTLFVFFSASLTTVSSASPLQIAMGKGLILGLCTLALYTVSIAHFNPSITLAMFCRGAINRTTAMLYLAAQLLGSFIAALVIKITLPPSDHIRVLDIPAKTDLHLHQSVAIELILSFFFVFTVLRTLRLKKPYPMIALVSAAAITVASIFGNSLTGGIINYATYIGPRFVFQGTMPILSISEIATYLVAPLLGALIAWYVDRYFRCDHSCMCLDE